MFSQAAGYQCFSPLENTLCISLQGCNTGISCLLRRVEQWPWCFVPQVCRRRKHKCGWDNRRRGNKRTCLPCRPNWLFHIFALQHVHTLSTNLWTGNSHPRIHYRETALTCKKMVTDIVTLWLIRHVTSAQFFTLLSYCSMAVLVALHCLHALNLTLHVLSS